MDSASHGEAIPTVTVIEPGKQGTFGIIPTTFIRSPPRRLVSLAVQRLIVLVVGLSVAALLWLSFQSRSPSPVYGVAALRDELARNPAAWMGRTVRVYAVFGYCIPGLDPRDAQCLPWQPALFDVTEQPGGALLPVTTQPVPDLLAGVRHLPLVGALFPAPRTAQRDTPAIYRIRLTAVPGIIPMQIQAVLLDSDPSLPPATQDNHVSCGSARTRAC